MAAKTRVKKAIGASLQNLPAPIAALAAQFGTLSLAWALGISAATGLLATFRELAEDRGKELGDFIEEHKAEFKEDIINSPEFVTVVINVWEKHILETAEQKRARLRNFLLSFGSGKEIAEDLHTKIYAIIDQMTDKEAAVFGIMVRGCNRAQFRNMHINHTSMHGLSSYPDDVIKDIWHSLHAYRLVDVADDGVVGGIMSLKQITPFGEMFYDYVL
jgi:hypothetical protein